MANSILTIDMITRESLRVLENNLVLTRNVNRQYDNSFAKEGAKIGATLRIRKPDRALVNTGAVLQVADETQQYGSLTVSNQANIGLAFTSAELTMSLQEFSDTIIVPRVSQLAAYIDNDVASVFKQIGQSVGTPGTTPATSAVLLAGQQKLNEAAAMMNPRYATVNPAANAGLVEGMKGLFNPGNVVANQFKSGMISNNILGYDEINMSQSIATFTTGTRTGAMTVTTTVSTQGATALVLTINSGGTVKAGDVFTIAACNAVNPQTRQSTGSLFQFVVPVDTTASSTTLTLAVTAMYDATQALATMDALPVSGAVVTFVGGASTVYPQNLIYHKDSIIFATADLVLHDTGKCSRMNHNGISMRYWEASDIVNDKKYVRLDVLYGFTAIRPEMAVRLWG